MRVEFANEKILAVVNDISEYDSLKKFLVKSQLLNSSVIKILARVRDHDFDRIKLCHDLDIIFLSNTSQSWLKFLLSAKL